MTEIRTQGQTPSSARRSEAPLESRLANVIDWMQLIYFS